MEFLRKLGKWIGWICTAIGAIDLPDQVQKWTKYFASLAGIAVNWDVNILGEYGRWALTIAGLALLLISYDVPRKMGLLRQSKDENQPRDTKALSAAPSHAAQEADLKVVITRHTAEWETEFGDEDTVYHGNTIVGFETTLIPSRPLQVARILLKLDDQEQEMELLGPPLYAESIRLPLMIEMETISTLRFKLPVKYHDKTGIMGKLMVLAAGKYWHSDTIKVL